MIVESYVQWFDFKNLQVDLEVVVLWSKLELKGGSTMATTI